MPLNDIRTRGSRLRISATDFNNWQRAAQQAANTIRESGDVAGFDYPLTIARVRNDSGDALDRFDVVGLDDPLILPTDNLASFKARSTFGVTVPEAGTHEGRWGVLLEPLRDGAIGAAAVAGVMPVGLVLASGTDKFAEIDNDRTVLLSGSSGTAQILWKAAANESGADWRWAIVRIGAGSGTSTKAQYINFTLAGALTTSTASVASCTVNSYWGGGTDPGGTVTVYNEAASSNYIFAAASGNHGIATYDPTLDRYRIIQVEC